MFASVELPVEKDGTIILAKIHTKLLRLPSGEEGRYENELRILPIEWDLAKDRKSLVLCKLRDLLIHSITSTGVPREEWFFELPGPINDLVNSERKGLLL